MRHTHVFAMRACGNKTRKLDFEYELDTCSGACLLCCIVQYVRKVDRCYHSSLVRMDFLLSSHSSNDGSVDGELHMFIVWQWKDIYDLLFQMSMLGCYSKR